MLREPLDALVERPLTEVLEVEERLGDLHPPGQRRLEQLVAVREVAVDGPQRDPGPGGHVLHRGLELALDEQCVHRVEDGVAVAVAPGPATVDVRVHRAAHGDTLTPQPRPRTGFELPAHDTD